MNIRGMNAWNTTRIAGNAAAYLPVTQRLKVPAVQSAGLLLTPSATKGV